MIFAKCSVHAPLVVPFPLWLKVQFKTQTGIFLSQTFAECAQAVVILRSTSYIKIELNALHLKSNEIQSNRYAIAILPLIAFLRID